MGNAKSAQENEPAPAPGKSHDGLGKIYAAEMEQLRRRPCCRHLLRIIFIILSVITIIQSIVVISVTVASAIASKLYNKEQSGRLVAMIILAVTAAVTMSVVIYGVIAVFRRRKKPLHAIAAALIITSIIQAVILGVAVRVTSEDEIMLNRSLVESFRLAREDNPRHVKLWAATQSDLDCCGVYSSEDYRIQSIPKFFPPDVPISCCPGYDPSRSDLVQERERQSCRSKRQFYELGCKGPIVDMLSFSATLVLSNTCLLIFLSILLAITSTLLAKKESKKTQEDLTQVTQVVTAPTPMPRASLSTKTKSFTNNNAL